MRNVIPTAILFLAFLIFSLLGCQRQEITENSSHNSSEIAHENEKLEHKFEKPTETNSEMDLPMENSTEERPESGNEKPAAKNPGHPTDSPATDYYFMGSLYGLGDYPGLSTLLDTPDALSRLKQFYNDLICMVQRVEYHPQSLVYDGTYTGDPKFSSNGLVNEAGDDNNVHTSLKTLMIGKSEYEAFNNVLEAGANFDEDDFTVYAVTDSIPILLGYDYIGVYNIGDKISLSLHMQPLQFTVIGFLKKNTTFQFDQKIPLDQHIIAPFYDIEYGPADNVNEFYQEIYYLQKCDGFVSIAATEDAEQMFRDVQELAKKYDLLFAVTPTKCRISECLTEAHVA